MQKFISEQNDLTDEINDDHASHHQNSKSRPNAFQDQKLKLDCIGHCGSKLMNLLLTQTNLKYLKHEKLPRLFDVSYGRLSKRYYEKLSFISTESEGEFFNLLLDSIETEIQKCSMGIQDFSSCKNVSNFRKF